MAEGGGLLNRYTAITRIVGSNPIPSATSRASFASGNKTLLPAARQDIDRRKRLPNHRGISPKSSGVNKRINIINRLNDFTRVPRITLTSRTTSCYNYALGSE